jgi:hypothetical protein
MQFFNINKELSNNNLDDLVNFLHGICINGVVKESRATQKCIANI